MPERRKAQGSPHLDRQIDADTTAPFASQWRPAMRTLLFYPGRILLLQGQRRHLRKWILSTKRDYLLRKPSPWITFDAIEFLARRVVPGWKVFEYGSGGSTLYWLSMGTECVSIEHDAEWHAKLLPLIPGGAKIDYRLVPPEPAGSGSARSGGDDPEFYHSSLAEFRGNSFWSYVTQIDEFPAGHFDLVLIDGRSRASCIRHAMPKVRPGGMLVVDNGDRSRYYRSNQQQLNADFELISFPGLCPAAPCQSQTDVFVRRSRV